MAPTTIATAAAARNRFLCMRRMIRNEWGGWHRPLWLGPSGMAPEQAQQRVGRPPEGGQVGQEERVVDRTVHERGGQRADQASGERAASRVAGGCRPGPPR